MEKVYGYVRAFPNSLDIDGQVAMMREMKISDRDIFIEERRGGDCKNLRYQKLMEKLKAGDLLYISGLGALGDNHAEIGRQWRILTKEKKADMVVLDMPLVDTRRGKMQCGTLVGDVVLSMLDFYTETEWSTRRQKQKEGIERAKNRGVQFGRPELPMPSNFDAVYQKWRRKEIKGREAAELCQISTALFYKRASRMREKEKGSVYAAEGGVQKSPLI